jgi:hypothetical protein
MTVPKAKKATQQKEREQLIQDIKQQNPSITDKQLSRYNIDDLRKIKMATAPKPEVERGMTVDEQYRQEKRLGTFPQKMQYGGKMKKKYKDKGKVTSDKDRIKQLAIQLANAEANFRGYSVSDKDIKVAEQRLLGSGLNSENPELRAEAEKQLKHTLDRLGPRPAGKFAEPVFGTPNYAHKYQYGGMADMSAAPMIKQPQTKKRKASGFRTKYSKGGGVRSSKYKL